MRRAETRQPSFAARLTHGWTRFWFAPGSAANLGFCRLVTVGIFFSLYDARGWADWAGMDGVLWLPMLPFRALDLRPLSALALAAIALVCKGALLFAAVGFFTRTSAAVAAVSTFYLLGLRHNFGKVFYNDAVVPLILLILAVARSGDRWSVDCLLRRARNRFRSGTETSDAAPAEYTWPIRLVWLLTVMVFFAAGVAKLRSAGFEWVFSDQLSDLLIGQQHSPTAPSTTIGLALAEHKAVCRVLAGAIVALEISSPLALVDRRARAVIVPGLLAFVSSLPVLFGFHFKQHFALFVFWIPWNRLGRE
jgi:uncharacterized membrane protein YphA (DoxX/SURF4 family)